MTDKDIVNLVQATLNSISELNRSAQASITVLGNLAREILASTQPDEPAPQPTKVIESGQILLRPTTQAKHELLDYLSQQGGSVIKAGFNPQTRAQVNELKPGPMTTSTVYEWSAQTKPLPADYGQDEQDDYNYFLDDINYDTARERGKL